VKLSRDGSISNSSSGVDNGPPSAPVEVKPTARTAQDDARGLLNTSSSLLRALGYVRVSTDVQAEAGYSLPEQQDRITEYCRQNGIILVDTISDDFTGKILLRPGLGRVSELAEAQAFDVLICVKLDRLSRYNYLGRQYEKWLAERDIQVLFVEQRFEATPAGRLQRGIMGEFAEYELELIRERTMSGRLKRAVSEHVMPCKTDTYGYHYVTRAEAGVLPEYNGKAGHLVTIDEEAQIIRRIFEFCAAGRSIRSIAIALNEDGVRTRLGKLWSPATLRGILRNETYVGRLYYGKLACQMTENLTPSGNVSMRKTPRPRSEWVEMACPAIVTEELFQACQRRLDENQERLRGRPTRIWLLHGVVVCGKCKGRHGAARSCTGYINRRKNCVYRRYVCTSIKKLESGSHCGTAVEASRLEALALDALRRAAEPNRLAEFARRDAEERQKQAGFPQEEVTRLQTALTGLDEEEGRLADGALRGFARHIVQEKVEALHQKREQLNRQLVEARSRLAYSITSQEAGERAEAAAARLRAALPTAEQDPQCLQELFRLFLEIRIYPDREPHIHAKVPILG
jgi:site-specific DNA recombinase